MRNIYILRYLCTKQRFLTVQHESLLSLKSQPATPSTNPNIGPKAPWRSTRQTSDIETPSNQRRLSDIAATQAKEALAIKTARVSRAADKPGRSRKMTYWKGRQAGYSSAMKKQKWQFLPPDPKLPDQERKSSLELVNGVRLSKLKESHSSRRSQHLCLHHTYVALRLLHPIRYRH